MISLHENIMADNIAWFWRWFDSTYYHKLYSHRSDAEARYFLDGLIHYLPLTRVAVKARKRVRTPQHE